MHAQMHAVHTDNPRLIRAIIVIITVIVIVVAFVANGAAYLGGVSFVRDVMGLSPIIAYVFGGIIEMILAVLSLATLARSYTLQPTAGLRVGLWVAGAASAGFGAAHEIVAYATGKMLLVQALPGAAWRIGVVVASVFLWELLIKQVCGPRARQARDAENQHRLMYRYLKRVQWVGLTQGTRFAPLARMLERHARMQTAKHVSPEERTAVLNKFHESQEASAAISVAMASLAQMTNLALTDLGDVSAPPLPTPAPRPAVTNVHTTEPVHAPEVAAPVASEDAHADANGPMHVQTVQPTQDVRPVSPVQEAETYTRTAAATVAASARAIRADLSASQPQTRRGNKPDKAACIALIRATYPGMGRLDVSATEVRAMLINAGHNISQRSADNYKNEALAS